MQKIIIKFTTTLHENYKMFTLQKVPRDQFGLKNIQSIAFHIYLSLLIITNLHSTFIKRITNEIITYTIMDKLVYSIYTCLIIRSKSNLWQTTMLFIIIMSFRDKCILFSSAHLNYILVPRICSSRIS